MVAILADDNLKCIFLNENDRIPIRISLKFVPRSPINIKWALVQVMVGKFLPPGGRNRIKPRFKPSRKK